MNSTLLKRILALVIVAGGVAGLGFGQTRVTVTGDAVASFYKAPTASQVVSSFTTTNRPLCWGVGYEVIHRHVGFGGLYTVDFERASETEWWLDWYGEAFYLSYHLFAHRTLVDPFVSIGLGSAGRVSLTPNPPPGPTETTLLLSIFPVVSGGVGVDLEGFYVGAKVSYLPIISPPPVTTFENVPIGHVQVVVSAGIALGR